MKPISFEGLRRLMRGHRDREPDSSQTFKRSNSFKRATFRKSLHKHEKVTLPNGLVVKTSAVQRKESVSSTEERKDDGYSTDGGGDGGGGGPSNDLFSSNAPTTTSANSNCGGKGVISYGQWVAASTDDEYRKARQADDSCPSTLSTNKLSSLDSGVRHSIDSSKTYSVDSNKRLSLDYRRVIGLDSAVPAHRPDLSRCPATPSRRSVESNFRRSLSTESPPAPPTRLKSLLGSPRVAPKHRDHSPSTSIGVGAYSIHGTPNRNRVLSSQPMSAPSTPGKQIQRVLHHQRPSSHTPTHQPLRSSLHDRERFCAVHGSPALQRVQGQSRPSALQSRQSNASANSPPPAVRSPKPFNRWSALLSNSIFSRSPARKSQTLKANLHTQLSSENLLHLKASYGQKNPLRKERLQQSHHQIYQTGFDSPVLRQRSVQSSHNSPALLRSHAVNNSVGPIPNSLDARLGIARAIGGPRTTDDGAALVTGAKDTAVYESPYVLRRSLPSQCSNTPVISRQSSTPAVDVNASVFLRSRPLSSPPPPSHPGINTSLVLSDQPLLNSSQFYPGKLASSSLVSGLPSVSIVGGRSISSDRSTCLNDSHDRPTPPLRTLSAERPRTPGSSNSRLSVTTWGRPFSLALGCAKGKADLLSPASMTSETSNRSDKRKRGPSLLVGKASWFSRNSPARKSFRVSNKNKKMTIIEFAEEEEEVVGEDDADLPPPPPPRPARLIPPEEYKKLREQSKSGADLDEPVFIPPQKRKPSAPVKFPMSLWRKTNHVPEIRSSSHADLLMPLSQSAGSKNIFDNRNEKTTALMQALLRDQTREPDDDGRDTNSEPGGSRFSVAPKNKPKSVPNTTRLNLKLAKNPDALLKALGFETSRKKRQKSSFEKNVDAVNEQIITQLLLEQLSSRDSSKMVNGVHSSAPDGSFLEVAKDLESSESLSSLVSSVISSRASNGSKSKRKSKKVRRRKSHRRVPSVPAYPSWKKTQKGVGATAAAARLENGT
ncbi:hypothetical protein FHG87_001923 [Trinorchestia longiramus]|nr:hypothetical protein FHG87_001923 [Trinorchestia longiramus]